MKYIVVYNSSTGFTEKYAKWIAEELDCQVVPYKEYCRKPEKNAEILIYGGGIMAGRVKGLDEVKKRQNYKQLVVFATGATSHEAEKAVCDIRNNNLTSEEQRTIPFYYYDGGIDYERMKLIPKKVLHVLRNSLEKNKARTEDENHMLMMLSESHDMTNKEYLADLLAAVKGV